MPTLSGIAIRASMSGKVVLWTKSRKSKLRIKRGGGWICVQAPTQCRFPGFKHETGSLMYPPVCQQTGTQMNTAAVGEAIKQGDLYKGNGNSRKETVNRTTAVTRTGSNASTRLWIYTVCSQTRYNVLTIHCSSLCLAK
eukprot:c12929_g1_i1 orf=587-1003(+)